MTITRLVRAGALWLMLAVLLVGGDASAEIVTIAALLREPARYNQQSVTVSGIPGPIRRVKGGNPPVEFVGFRLADESGAFVYVLHQGGATAGVRIEVTGVYHATWKAIEPKAPFTVK